MYGTCAVLAYALSPLHLRIYDFMSFMSGANEPVPVPPPGFRAFVAVGSGCGNTSIIFYSPYWPLRTQWAPLLATAALLTRQAARVGRLYIR